MCRFFNHHWERWETFTHKVIIVVGDKEYEGLEPRQKRKCLICGKEQRRKI